LIKSKKREIVCSFIDNKKSEIFEFIENKSLGKKLLTTEKNHLINSMKKSPTFTLLNELKLQLPILRPL
jgi:hypothetical protein